MADTWPRKCLECGVDVQFDGDDPVNQGFGPCKKKRGNHVVESKLYFHPGARDINDIRDRKKFSPLLILQPVYTREVDGKRLQSRGVIAQFAGGKFETGDPEIQYLIETTKKDIKTGDEGIRMWQKIYMTPQQQVDAAQDELKRTNRKIEEANELLRKVEARSKNTSSAEADAKSKEASMRSSAAQKEAALRGAAARD